MLECYEIWCHCGGSAVRNAVDDAVNVPFVGLDTVSTNGLGVSSARLCSRQLLSNLARHLSLLVMLFPIRGLHPPSLSRINV